MTLTPDQLKAIATDLRSQANLLDPPGPSPVPANPVTPADARWVPGPSDDFSSGKLDPAIWWKPYDGVPGTAGVGMRKGSLCTLRNGNLIIAGERPAGSTDYSKFTTTGVAMGPVAQTYGRWEIEAKSSPGAGFWTNLQLWPTAGKQPAKYGKGDGWPDTIEFDINETPEADRSVAHTTLHYAGNKTVPTTTKLDCTQFHTWIVEWTPGLLIALIDGIEVFREDDPDLVPTTPHHFVGQTDAGAWASKPTSKDPLRVELEIDHVRTWSYVG